MAPVIVPSDIYPAVRRFLLESGLQRALKAFDKETATEDETAAAGKSKKARALAELELTAACQMWLDSRLGAGGGAEAQPQAAGEAEPKKAKKRRPEEAPEAPAPAAEEPAPPAGEERPKKKKRSDEAAEERPRSAEAKTKASERQEEAEEEVAAEGGASSEANGSPKADKKDKKKDKGEKKPGVPFKRIDEEKWVKAIKDARLLDNSHKAKEKFGSSAGDSWADKASEDLMKVKGKGFRKEMAKKKRASWKGGGEIDQGVNSIKFEDSDESDD